MPAKPKFIFSSGCDDNITHAATHVKLCTQVEYTYAENHIWNIDSIVTVINSHGGIIWGCCDKSDVV
jgi:hypothetical protein